MSVTRLTLILTQLFIGINAEANLELPEPRLVILGSTGVGKSSLANVLLGQRPEAENCTFAVCKGSDSCTKETKYGIGNFTGFANQSFTVVDTPGFGDTDNDMANLINEMTQVLKDEVKSANAFLLLFNGKNVRFDQKIQQMLREMQALFGKHFWDHVILGVSFWPHDQVSLKQRQYSGKTEESWLAEMNRQLKERFDLKHDLKAVFIDSWAKQPWNTGDSFQQEVFDREALKLWNFMVSKGKFKFRTIQYVLGQLDECQKLVTCLSGNIQASISNIVDQVKHLNATDQEIKSVLQSKSSMLESRTSRLEDESSIFSSRLSKLDSKASALESKTLSLEFSADHRYEDLLNKAGGLESRTFVLENELSDHRLLITESKHQVSDLNSQTGRLQARMITLEIETRSNISELKSETEWLSTSTSSLALSKSSLELQTSMLETDLKSNLKTETSNLDEQIKNLHLAPVGSIIAWVPKPNKWLGNQDLPRGWMKCDGGVIPEPSIWAGNQVPDLNSQRLFLRGGNDNDVLKEEADQLQDHGHDDGGHSHDMGGTLSDRNYRGDALSLATAWMWGGHKVKISYQKGPKSYAEIGNPTSGRHGNETRPKNMGIIWIMRIF